MDQPKGYEVEISAAALYALRASTGVEPLDEGTAGPLDLVISAAKGRGVRLFCEPGGEIEEGEPAFLHLEHVTCLALAQPEATLGFSMVIADSQGAECYGVVRLVGAFAPDGQVSARIILLQLNADGMPSKVDVHEYFLREPTGERELPAAYDQLIDWQEEHKQAALDALWELMSS